MSTGADSAGPAASSLTSFVGRDREIARLRELLGTSRLVTLTGSGGSGKTRLARELTAALVGVFPDGIHFVELGPLTDESLVVEQTAEHLGVRGPASAASIAARVGEGRPLLVLDNCEHVVGSAAALVGDLLHRCPNLVVLATSREALSIPGEVAWLVPPLSLPDPAVPATPDALRDSEAVRLFLDRAADVVPSFRLTTDNAADVAGICRRLDGIPLALELAAARLRSLGPAQLLARLDDRFSVLTTRARGTLPRHRTLRAAIDWSYGLLSEPERFLMDTLAVFSGTFDLEAAEDVCPGDLIAEEDVLDLVSGLVEKSLIEVLEHGSSVRYRLLETVRQYAGERLEAEGRVEEMHRRHARYFVGLAADAEPHLTVPGRRAWIDRLSRDVDNLRQALAWTRDSDPPLHLRLAGSLGWYWFGSEHWSEGRRWLEGALALPAARDKRDRVDLLFALGVLTSLQGDRAVARPALQEAIDIAEELGDARRAAYARNYLGLSLAAEGRPEAVPLLETALAYFRESADLYGGRLALLCLGAAAAARGALDEAAELTTEGVSAARAFAQDRELAISQRQLALVELRRGSAREAAQLAREALDGLSRDPQHYFIAMSLEVLACALVDLGRPSAGVRLFGAGERIREGIGVAVADIEAPVYRVRIDGAREGLGARAFAEAWAAGRDLPVAEAISTGIAEADALSESATPVEGPGRDGEDGDDPVRISTSAESGEVAPAERGLVVCALGPLEVRLDGRRLETSDWSHARPRELLMHLLVHPRGRTRQEVGDALWPDSSAAQVKNSFHVALHHLRKTLGRPEWIRFEEDRYRIETSFGIWFDVAEFETAVREAQRAVRAGSADALEALRSGLALYRGDFLSEEPVSDWHLDHRDRLRSLYVDGMVTLGGLLLDEGVPDEAVEVCRRVVLLDQLHEEAHRHLMTALARSGDRRASIRQFEQLARLLDEELSAAPEPATLALHKRILAAEPV